MKEKKGFTLIELLAVIVILAIIALIATPMILGVIETAKKSASESSALGYIDAVEKQVAINELETSNGIIKEGIYKVESLSSLNVEVKGSSILGKVEVDENGIVSRAALEIDGYYVFYDGKKVISSKEKNDEYKALENEKISYKESILNGADPVIKNSLIPVIIEKDGTVKKADIYSKWYSYENKEWANAVILFGDDTYNFGDTIEESAIKQYYVWIPRYKYQLWNVNSEVLYPNGTEGESAINIVFESKNTRVSNGDENTEWLTHPAFTSFDTDGLWVGKFETSYNEETYTDNTKFLTTNPNYTTATSGTNIIIKPNVRNLTTKNASTLYTMSREVNSELNSHMMKNTEWGAVAYLTYSNYGKCTNGVCEEVYINNVSTGYVYESPKFSGQLQFGTTVTGCSGDSSSAAANSNNNKCEIGYAWNEENNKASTTGNISGIYDMHGGNWEYVMAVIADSNGNPLSGRSSLYISGFNGIYGCPACDSSSAGLIEETTGINYPTDSRYYDLYEYDYDLSTNIWHDYTNGKLGDATKEIAATKIDSNSGDKGLWYTDQARFPSPYAPWFQRGGGFSNINVAGIFYFNSAYGSTSINSGFRVVLAY